MKRSQCPRTVALLLACTLLTGLLGACAKNPSPESSAPGKETTTTASSGTSTAPTDPSTTDPSDTEPADDTQGGVTHVKNTKPGATETTHSNTTKPTTKPTTPEEAYGYIEEYTGQTYYSKLTTAQTLYRINGEKLNDPERNLMLSLAGIVAQTKSEIFISYTHSKIWEQALEEYYGIRFVDIDSPWEMVAKFKDRIKDKGFVTYETWIDGKNYALNPNAASSINVATVIAGVENYLIVEDSLVEKAKAAGLTQKMDGRDWDEYEIYQKYKEKTNKDIIFSLAYFSATQRDLAIALKTMCWRGESLSDFEDMLMDMNPGAVCTGWHDDELAGVKLVSACGLTQIANDHASNFPVYGGLKKTNFKQRPAAAYAKTGEKKHYLTLHMSDGDNIMWLSREFADNAKYYAAPGRGKIPLTWSLSASLVETAPVFAQYLYNNATINDHFMAGFSGIGYFYPSMEPEGALTEITKRSAEYMKAMDMNYLTIMDYDSADPQAVKKILPNYSEHKQIKGGFVGYVWDHFIWDSREYPGAIFWSDGKPFVNFRDSLGMYGSGSEKAVEMAQAAHRINNYKVDPTVIEGYTVMNINCWNYSYDDIVLFTSLLDDDVKIVGSDEFFSLLNKNIKNKTDKYKLDDYTRLNPPDYANMPTLAMSEYFDFGEIEKMTASTRASFDFEDGMQGWKTWTGDMGLDQAYRTLRDGKAEIVLFGSQIGQMDVDDINASMYTRLKLPKKDKLTLDVVGKNEMAAIRLLVADENRKVHIVKDWETSDDNGSHVFDISQFAGQTVAVMIQMKDGSLFHSGSRILITDVNIA